MFPDLPPGLRFQTDNPGGQKAGFDGRLLESRHDVYPSWPVEQRRQRIDRQCLDRAPVPIGILRLQQGIVD